jgi:hypothetical protein
MIKATPMGETSTEWSTMAVVTGHAVKILDVVNAIATLLEEFCPRWWMSL